MHKRILSVTLTNGFTIVELLVVISIIGILAALSVFSFNGWQRSTSEREVKSELTNVASAMKSKQNFANAYPTAVPTDYKVSSGVALNWGGGDGLSYCIDGSSSRITSIKMYVKEDGQIKTGTCAGGAYVAGFGTTWTLGNAASQSSWEAVIFANNLYVAVASDGAIMTSPNGVTWTSRSGGSTLYAVTYANGQFVAVGDGTVRTSPDGITWTARTGGPIASFNWRTVTYGNGMYVAAGISSGLMTSPDGITWTARTVPSGAFYSSLYVNSKFYVLGSYNVLSSTDGISWSEVSHPLNAAKSLIYANGMFVAVGGTSSTNGIMTSTDGTTWTTRYVTGSSYGVWYSVAYGNGNFVATGNNNRLMTSEDGISWTGVSAPQNNYWRGLVFAQGQMVSVAGNGTNRVMTAP